MHELSVALGIVKIAEKEALKFNSSKIISIELEIGTLAGVELDSLHFVWPAAVKGTILEHAKKEIKIIKAEALCIDCDTVYSLETNYDECPQCKSSFRSFIKGKELKVKSFSIT